MRAACEEIIGRPEPATGDTEQAPPAVDAAKEAIQTNPVTDLAIRKKRAAALLKALPA